MKKKIVTYITMLLTIDQGIKIFIYFNLLNDKIILINNALSITPVFNKNLSYINSKFGFTGNRIGHAIFLFALLVIVILLYGYIKEIKGMNKLAILTFIFGISGLICSLIDTIFWNGSLDFIRIHGAFTFDTKDLYITIVEIFIAVMIMFNLRAFFESSWIDRLKDFYSYLSRSLTFKKR